MSAMVFFINLFLGFFCLSYGSAMGDLAAAMQPGQWRELVTQNFGGGGILNAQNGVSILDYTDEAQWDPVEKKLLIIGTSTGYGHANQEWIEYSEATNSWARRPKPSFYLGYHSYDHAALDPVRRHYYVRIVESHSVYRYHFTTGQWTQLPNMPQQSSCCSALEYFPEMDRVVYVHTGGAAFNLFNPSTNTWSTQAWGMAGPGHEIHTISEYDPVNGVLYFGGGNYHPNEFYKLDGSGKVTKPAGPPVSLGISGACANHTVDPVSGQFLVFKPNGATHEYNPAGDSWRTAGTHPLASGGSQIAVTAKIPDYGVIVGVSSTVDKVFLYKHSASSSSTDDIGLRAKHRPAHQPPYQVLAVYDSRGKRVRSFDPSMSGRLLNGRDQKGRSLSNGVYFMVVRDRNGLTLPKTIAVIQ